MFVATAFRTSLGGREGSYRACFRGGMEGSGRPNSPGSMSLPGYHSSSGRNLCEFRYLRFLIGNQIGLLSLQSFGPDCQGPGAGRLGL